MTSLTTLVTGIAGQDGTYLAKKLLSEDYIVYGLLGPATKEPSLWRLAKLGLEEHPNLKLLDWDIRDPRQIKAGIKELRPDEVFNFASHSFVGDSLHFPYETSLVSAVGVVNILEALSTESPETRFLQAGSSEIFGNCSSSPQSEMSQFAPRNIYGSAKLMAHWATINYRNSHGMPCSNVILYNHESPLRAETFVTRKITKAVANIKLGRQKDFKIGNLSAVRDWGYAPDYVDAMRLIIGRQESEDFVLATGKLTSVREFIKIAFDSVGIEVESEGLDQDEKILEKRTGRILATVDPDLYRDAENAPLVGDARKALNVLGWEASTPIDKVIQEMVLSDLGAAEPVENNHEAS
jgi:GDPmannose 4,6-dehydratase